MKDTEFYEHLLGLRTPWRVDAVKLDPGCKSVEVKVGYDAGTLWANEEGERLPVYDHVERRWRHLDTCGFETRLVCRVPVGADAGRQGRDGAGALGRQGHTLLPLVTRHRDAARRHDLAGIVFARWSDGDELRRREARIEERGKPVRNGRVHRSRRARPHRPTAAARRRLLHAESNSEALIARKRREAASALCDEAGRG